MKEITTINEKTVPSVNTAHRVITAHRVNTAPSRTVFLLLLSLFILCFTSQCIGPLSYDRALIERLKNRGPVALSIDNPYLAANLLIAKEMERSVQFRGFVEHQGTPHVVTVVQDIWGTITMELYYAKESVYYQFQEAESEWVISGPFSLDGERYEKIHRLQLIANEEPSIALPYSSQKKPHPSPVTTQTASPSAEERFVDSSFQSPARTTVTPSPTPHPIETPIKLSSSPPPKLPPASPTVVPHKRVIKNEKLLSTPPPVEVISPPHTITHSPTPSPQKQLSIDEITKKIHPPEAELSPRGDLVHYVTSSKETIEILAEWYTSDRSNGPRIKRINQLPETTLMPGDTVVIPRYMLKNRLRLTKEALELLQR